MKRFVYKKYIQGLAIGLLVTVATGCDDYLDATPESKVSTEDYLYSADQLKAYITTYYVSEKNYGSEADEYGGRLPSHYGSGGESFYSDDLCTDNAVGRSGNARFIKDNWNTGSSGGSWNFRDIRRINFFLNTVIPRYEAGELSGSSDACAHYIGEGYFLRAHQYFYRLRKLGDFPIVKDVLTDNEADLIEQSKRQPRNEVARFILQDLDQAIALMQNDAPAGARTRLNKWCAYLLKARVALYEASWLKYHAGTPLVPKADGWPGASKDYLSSYQFPSGSLDGEISFFLDEAMKAAEKVGDAFELQTNNKIMRNPSDKTVNPYYDMFAGNDASKYSEVLLWRQYSYGTLSHWFNHYLYGGGNRGWTRQMEQTFLMENGLPVYANNSGYAGDDYIEDTKTDRDWRWKLFMKAPGEVRAVVNEGSDTYTSYEYFPSPASVYVSDSKIGTSTGYLLGKGYSMDYADQVNGNGESVSVIFRAAEAYLIYLEASYMSKGQIDSKADSYWKKLRARAGVDQDYSKTIAATDMSKEGLVDWGAYSHGQLVDATLYNIRRERRCELMNEGFRYDDLCRWRAMDQLNGYHLEGAKVWGPMKADYAHADGNYIEDNVGATISAQNLSLYNRPLQALTTNNLYYNGFSFYQAHYLNPIANSHFLQTSSDGKTASTSPIYQNPGWSTEAGTAPSYN